MGMLIEGVKKIYYYNGFDYTKSQTYPLPCNN